MKEININSITRLEGHGKIKIFLNDAGNVENAYFQVPELRGFENSVKEDVQKIYPSLQPGFAEYVRLHIILPR